MGRPKPLLPYAGRTVVEQILSVLTATPVNEIIAITGYSREPVELLVAQWPARAVFNPDFTTGEMLGSVQAGLRAVSSETRAALIALCDQPALDRSVVEQIIAAYWAGRGSVIIPSFKMRRGHPVLIDRKHWDRILDLPEGQTLRSYIRGLAAEEIHHVEVNTASILQDLDTPQDYQDQL
jgi:molybdenum cofactor cytidylyltransferase